MLLSGPPSCGKTSLLFQFAFNSAMEEAHNSNGTVIFICSRRRLEAKPPYLSQGVDSSSETFHRIQMKYLDDDEGIKKFFAAFHLYDKFPVSVVIDDFGDFFEERYFLFFMDRLCGFVFVCDLFLSDSRSCQQRYGNPRGRDLAMVRTLALCHNAMIHANETRPCKLLLSDTHHGDSPRLLFIFKRWVSTIFTIQGWLRSAMVMHFGNFLLYWYF